MPIVHAFRSESANTNFTARFSWGGEKPGYVLQAAANNTPIQVADAAAIGGFTLDMNRTNTIARALVWNAAGIQFNGNLTTSRAVSVLARMRFGIGSVSVGIFGRDSAINWGANRLMMHITNASNCIVQANNEFGQNCFNTTLGTGVAQTTAAYTDLVLVWDGGVTAGGVKFFVDGTQVGSATAAAATNATFAWSIANMLHFGGNANANNCRQFYNEVVVWNNTIDVTAVPLVAPDGSLSTASLNGASRTAWVNVSAFNFVSSTDPGTANVILNTNYTINGTAYVGAYVTPAAVTASGSGLPALGLPQFMG